MIVPLSLKEQCGIQLHFIGRLKSESDASFRYQTSTARVLQLFIQAKLKWLICASFASAPFAARPLQTWTVDALHRPLSRQKPSFHPLMAGRNCFLWHRDAISWVCASQKRLLCVGIRWGEKRWPLSPALISTTFLKINGSCGITLPYTWRGTDGRQKPDIEFLSTHTCRESSPCAYLSS